MISIANMTAEAILLASSTTGRITKRRSPLELWILANIMRIFAITMDFACYELNNVMKMCLGTWKKY